MGQAKRRGTFEERKNAAVIEQENRKRELEEYRRLHPEPKSSIPSYLLPFLMVSNKRYRFAK